jgi:hypothetical protein
MVDPRPLVPKTRSNTPILQTIRSVGVGFGAGLVLWLVIAVITRSTVLGLVFGLLPCTAIGVWLGLTARR